MAIQGGEMTQGIAQETDRALRKEKRNETSIQVTKRKNCFNYFGKGNFIDTCLGKGERT